MQSQVKRGSNEVYNFGIHIIFVEYVKFVENLQTLQQQKKEEYNRLVCKLLPKA